MALDLGFVARNPIHYSVRANGHAVGVILRHEGPSEWSWFLQTSVSGGLQSGFSTSLEDARARLEQQWLALTDRVGPDAICQWLGESADAAQRRERWFAERTAG